MKDRYFGIIFYVALRKRSKNSRKRHHQDSPEFERLLGMNHHPRDAMMQIAGLQKVFTG